MVFSGASERESPQKKFMAMAPERSRPLHNFNMPCLKWGNQKLLRCMKLNSDGEIPTVDHRSSASEATEYEGFIGRRRESDSTKRRFSKDSESFKKLLLPPIRPYGEKSEIERDADDGFAEVRAKLMSELRSAANMINVSIPEEAEEDESAAAAATAMMPWNLRTRRSACTAPNVGCSNSKNEEHDQNSSPPPRTNNSIIKSLRLRGLSPAQERVVEKKERTKFSIPLSRQEIEDDFLLMTGAKPSRRPKKRARIVQKQLDTLYPGLWLSEITPDSYKVPDIPEPRKR